MAPFNELDWTESPVLALRFSLVSRLVVVRLGRYCATSTQRVVCSMLPKPGACQDSRTTHPHTPPSSPIRSGTNPDSQIGVGRCYILPATLSLAATRRLVQFLPLAQTSIAWPTLFPPSSPSSYPKLGFWPPFAIVVPLVSAGR